MKLEIKKQVQEAKQLDLKELEQLMKDLGIPRSYFIKLFRTSKATLSYTFAGKRPLMALKIHRHLHKRFAEKISRLKETQQNEAA